MNGTINSIKVYSRSIIRDYYGSGANGYILLRISSTDYLSNILTDYTSETWATYYYEWTTNPSTGNAWTWSDINNIVAGMYFQHESRTFNTHMHVSQMYIVVDYTPSSVWTPKIMMVMKPLADGFLEWIRKPITADKYLQI